MVDFSAGSTSVTIWFYIGDETVSINEKMIAEGYAWEYDGGTKNKNFQELREIRNLA